MSKYGYGKMESIRDTTIGFYNRSINKFNGDTIKIANGRRKYEARSKDNIVLADGQILGGMGTACGCELKAHGLWIERYRNGNVKEQGEYYCNEKIGRWIYYYESGTLRKIESYKRPYAVDLSEHRLDFIFKVGDTSLKNRAIKHGAYKSFYRNGKIREEGWYRFIEEYTTVDTIFMFDPETYEETLHIIERIFWKVKSIKYGLWNYYDESGKLVKTERIQGYRRDGQCRSIKERYKELFLVNKKEDETKEK